MDREEKVFKRLEHDYKFLEESGRTVLGVFLYGSDNYGLSYEGSDIDTKAIILPSFNDFCINRKPISTTHVISPLNEQIDEKDIRTMFDMFKKQNTNFIEILFTKYKIVNPVFEPFFKPLIEERELIAKYNRASAVRCMIGMALEKRKALEHRYPSIVDEIDKFGYSAKQCHHILRLEDFLTRYVSGELYENCLVPKEKEYLIDIKRHIENGSIMPVDRARELSDDSLENIRKVGDYFINSIKDEPQIDESALQLLNSVLTSVMKEHIRREVAEDDVVK